ncbi:MAG: hypothetical protein ACX930_11965 [Erythrobacter sp.]
MPELSAKVGPGLLAPAVAYFGAVFAVGFVLGTVRTLWLEQAIGPFAAVAIELPVILSASWLIAQWMLRGFGIVSRKAALFVGAVALALLWLAELALTVALGGSVGGFLRDTLEPEGLLGIAGQLLFALFPFFAVVLREQ